MRHPVRSITSVAAAAAVIMACGISPTAVAADAPYDVLVFSKTVGFRHDAIPIGIQTIRELGAANNFTVTATDRKSTRLNSSHPSKSRMPSSA